MSCGVGHRHGSDPALLLLRCMLAATAPIQPLAWEPPYATGVALKQPKRKKKKENELSEETYMLTKQKTLGRGCPSGDQGTLENCYAT